MRRCLCCLLLLLGLVSPTALALDEESAAQATQAQSEAFSEPEQKPSARREDRRERLMGEVRTLRESLKEYGVEPPVGFPYVSEKDMEDWLALWQRFKSK